MSIKTSYKAVAGGLNIKDVEVSLNYCSQNGGNLYRAPYLVLFLFANYLGEVLAEVQQFGQWGPETLF